MQDSLYTNSVDLQTTAHSVDATYSDITRLNLMKDDLIAITSHELRTPLTIIKNNLWMLLNNDKESLNDYAVNKLSAASQASMRAIDLINDIITVAELEGHTSTFTFENVNLELFITRVLCDLTKEAEEKKVHLILKQSLQTFPLVSIDKTHMRRALENILRNAIKYSPYDEEVYVDITQHGNMLEVSIQDHGTGISEENLKRLFTKFGRLEGSLVSAAEKGGTGLGLYICKLIIETHGGSIWATSRLGAGSTFTFSLPGVKA